MSFLAELDADLCVLAGPDIYLTYETFLQGEQGISALVNTKKLMYLCSDILRDGKTTLEYDTPKIVGHL